MQKSMQMMELKFLGEAVLVNIYIFRYKSRLAMSISSIVSDPNCLTYFVQFLDTMNALPLLKFYLDTENFKTAALGHLKAEQQSDEQGTLGSKKELQECKDFKTLARIDLENKDEINATCTQDDDKVPELKSFFDLSMRQPLTDDEKSQIYAETNKQIYQCTENNNRTKNSKEKNIDCLYEGGENKLCSDVSNARIATEKCINPASVNDAIAIYQKYLIADANQFISLPVDILSEISLIICQRAEIEKETSSPNQSKVESMPTIPPTCFVEAQCYVLDHLERVYLNEFLQSSFYGKYSVELIENGNPELSIYDILYSEATLFFFMEFLEQHNERECLDFWTSAINYRKSYISADRDTENASLQKTDKSNIPNIAQLEAQGDAMIIYEKFFSLQSEDRFWLSDRLRSQVEERICAADRVAYCFDLALQLVAKYLERKYFQDFLKSQLFQNYLNELKFKIHEVNVSARTTDDDKVTSSATAGESFSKTLHRKTLSDCSDGSRREVFRHNTLLAMDGNKLPQTRIKGIQQGTGSAMHIDARHLLNPNLLWRRSQSVDGVALKFGHINELGRYERDFEAVDDVGGEAASSSRQNWPLRLSGNKIKSAMRKLVHLPEEKVQEEIAWQVAEMIIKDVTSVTLGHDQKKFHSSY
ncbi:A-kinase anchor protein 10, mitochondrial isoform X2 [Bactrocera oleae]|uniref:A-kinase anchor protein 10, mitochondrial isoform X2 n=1 Tax=Bactrocera oleae TaxID=104688 RepID=UPI00387E975B